MLRILYDTVENQNNSDEISLHNMKHSDVHFNKETLIASSYAWLKNDNQRTFQDLEKYYRENNFNTYLIAKPFVSEDELTLENPNTNENLCYECLFHCNPHQKYDEVLCKYSENYDENFSKLLNSGFLKILNEEKIEESKTQHNSLLFEKLKNNTIKLNFVSLSDKESIEQMSKDIFESTGKKPKPEIIGNYNSEQPILTFLLEDGSLASHIGWTMKNVDGELQYKLLDLTNYFSKEKLNK